MSEHIIIALVKLASVFVLAFLVGFCAGLGYRLWRETRRK